MKTKIIQKLGVALIVLMATTTFNQVQAQKYGGSAYVKDNKGNARTLNAVTTCYHCDEADTKKSLSSSLSTSRGYDEYNTLDCLDHYQ